MTPGAASIWLQLVLCLLVIGVAGYWLSRCGGAIGEQIGMTGSWVGFVLLAAVTTLPEFVTTVSALRFADAPDIAVGGLLGSVLFNLVILAVLELLIPGGHLYERASRSHVLPAGFTIAMLLVAGAGLLLGRWLHAPMLARTGLATPLMLILWLLAMRALHRQERKVLVTQMQAGGNPAAEGAMALKSAIAGYAISALLVVAAGIWLPFVAGALAEAHGWTQSFVGTLMVAVITSAPELAVTLSAARLGAFDMAIGNVLGANTLNLFMLAVGDLIYGAAPLLSVASAAHAASVLGATSMTALFAAALVWRSVPTLVGRLSWVGAGLLAVYGASMLFQFQGVAR